MRTLAALATLAIIGAAPVALAEAWRVKPVLELGAPSNCKEADVSNLFFDLAETGNELLVKTSSGEAFSAAIAADGYVRTTLKVPVGKRNFSVDLTGNVVALGGFPDDFQLLDRLNLRKPRRVVDDIVRRTQSDVEAFSADQLAVRSLFGSIPFNGNHSVADR